MTAAQVSEAYVSALVKVQANARVPEANVSALVKVQAKAEVQEANISVLTKIHASAQVQEANVSALVYASPYATQRCDLWRITRLDGTVFCFTSLDTNFLWQGQVFLSCASLQDSASEASANLGSPASVTLTGLIDSDLITDQDIYGGLFDDAFVEFWVVQWGDGIDPASPFRVASGWIGKLTRNEASYEAEILGPMARLAQTALILFFTPGCRWQFGSSQCGVNAAALTISGIAVTQAIARYAVRFTPRPIPSETAIWNDGKLVWTSGKNKGVTCQTATVDWASGILSLWDLAPYQAAPGDTFSLVPGCSYDIDGCITYGNILNFGGFPYVPGPDALQQNAVPLLTQPEC